MTRQTKIAAAINAKICTAIVDETSMVAVMDAGNNTADKDGRSDDPSINVIVERMIMPSETDEETHPAGTVKIDSTTNPWPRSR